MRKIKVIHILNTSKYSGAENVVITLINSTKNYVDSTYVSLDGSIREYLNENKIKFEPVKKLTISEMRRVIKKIRPDIIHAHDFTAGIICSLSTNKPIVNHIHNNSPWIKHYNLKSFVYALSCLKYKKILTVSDSVMNEYVFGDYFKRKTKIVGNPIDINKIRTLAGKADIKYNIAFLGRLSNQKKPMLFLDIINQLKNRKPDLKVIMIGDGELREEVRKKIETYGLSNIISLVGFQKNPYKYLNQAMILLMPSSWEGYGLAAVEALALGKPVICSNNGGLPKIVNSKCGKICCEIKEYCEAITVLLSDKKEYNRASKESRKRADQLGNLREYTKVILKTYHDSLFDK